MGEEIEIVEGEKFFSDFSNISNFTSLKDGAEEYWLWPEEIGRGFFYVINLRPGLILAFADFKLWSSVAFSFSSKSSYSEINYHVLSNDLKPAWSWKDYNKKFYPDSDMSYMSYRPKWDGVLRFESDLNLKSITIYMSQDLFISFLDKSNTSLKFDFMKMSESELEDKLNIPLVKTPLINMRLFEILNCPYGGILKKTYLESKTLEVIVLSFCQLSKKMGLTGNRRTESQKPDFETMREIRDTLISDLISPPSLTDLSSLAGMNKNKLNDEFRKIYGTSVFDYLRVCRLEKSKDLLISTEKNVTQVAFDVGYSQQSNFTKEFKKYFGISPSEFQKLKN